MIVIFQKYFLKFPDSYKIGEFLFEESIKMSYN